MQQLPASFAPESAEYVTGELVTAAQLHEASDREIREAILTAEGAAPLYSTTGPGYENSAACKMVAVRCACCGLPLVDAISVETGIGPDCRKKYGYGNTAVGPYDRATATDLLAGAVATDAALEEVRSAVGGWLAQENPHKAANVLVHRIAVHQVGAAVAYLTAALAALGYRAMAARIGQRLGHVQVDAEGDTLVARLPYDPALVSAVASIPGRRTEKRTLPGGKRQFTVNLVPATQAPRLWEVLKTRLPEGTLVLGTKGYRVIPARATRALPA